MVVNKMVIEYRKTKQKRKQRDTGICIFEDIYEILHNLAFIKVKKNKLHVFFYPFLYFISTALILTFG